MEQAATSPALGHEKDKGDDKGKHDLKVKVFLPRDPQQHKKFSWPPEMLVGDAADEAAGAFGLTPGSQTLAKDGDAFNRTQTLAAAGVRDKDELMLVDVGGGV